MAMLEELFAMTTDIELLISEAFAVGVWLENGANSVEVPASLLLEIPIAILCKTAVSTPPAATMLLLAVDFRKQL